MDGFFLGVNNIYEAYRLPVYCSVFQAKIYTVDQASRAVSLMGFSVRSISFCSGNQAATKALDSTLNRSECVNECKDSLNSI